MSRKYLEVTIVMLSCVIVVVLSSCNLISTDKDRFHIDKDHSITMIDIEKTGPDIVVPEKVGNKTVRRISLRNKCFSKIDTINVSNVSELEFFKLNLVKAGSRSKLKKLDFSKNVHLRIIAVNGTKALEEVVFNKSCRSVLLFNTSIKKIDLNVLENIEHFTYFNGPLEDVDFSNNINLEQLHIGNANVKSVDIKMLKKLKNFGCYGVCLDEFDISNNPDLETIEVFNTNVKVLDVSNNPKLKKIEVDEGTEIIGETNAEIKYWTKEDIEKMKKRLEEN